MQQAYRQGRLDGLCGVYSLINAKRLLFPRTSEEDSVELFRECMDWLDKRSLLTEVIVEGMGINTLIGLSRDVIEPSTPRTLPLPSILPPKGHVGHLLD